MSTVVALVLALLFAWAMLCGLYWALTSFDPSEFWVCVGAASVITVLGGVAFALLSLVAVLF